MAASYLDRVRRMFGIGNCEFLVIVLAEWVTERRERAGAGSDVLAPAFLLSTQTEGWHAKPAECVFL